MPENIRALVVIAVLTGAVFWFARAAISERCIAPQDYATRRNVWFACVFIAFLSHNFWIFIVLSGALLLYFGRKDRNPFAFYCMLLFALPEISLNVPGFGLVNLLFEISYVRLLSLVVLLPLALKLRSQRDLRQNRPKFADACIALYLLLGFVMHLQSDSFTNSLRMTFYDVTGIALPYYVASRALSTFEDYREIIAALIVGIAVVAVIGTFETTRFWLLYDSLRASFDLPPPNFLVYLRRGVGGLLRAKASTAQPIVLGYLMMIALCLYTFIRHESKHKKTMWLAAAALTAGLIASLSRGPWVGTAAASMVIICLGPGRGKRAVWAVGVGGTALAGLLASPFGTTILDYLPFVGSIEAENVDYRVRLWQVSMEVFRQNPWFGDVLYMQNPMLEAMRQGQGIIDVVNSYLQILLAHGIVGLALFLAPFLWAIRSARKLQHAGIANDDPHIERLGRALLATIVGVMVTIATVSSINLIPILYWIVIGLCVGSTRCFYAETRKAVQRAYTDRYADSYNG